MKVIEYIEFPCGYKHYINVRGMGKYHSEMQEDICPLHGKNCKRGK